MLVRVQLSAELSNIDKELDDYIGKNDRIQPILLAMCCGGVIKSVVYLVQMIATCSISLASLSVIAASLLPFAYKKEDENAQPIMLFVATSIFVQLTEALFFADATSLFRTALKITPGVIGFIIGH